MARTLQLSFRGNVSAFAFSKVDRAKLYGRRIRQQLDPDGRAARRGALTRDGSLVVQQGMTAQGYFDEEERWWPVGDLVGLDAEGNALEKIPSTLGRPVDLEGPLPAAGLLDLKVKAVYALDPDEELGLQDDLRSELDQGSLFRFPFSYRGGYSLDDAWLVANDSGVYALVGESTELVWSELQTPVDEADVDDDDDLDDELDFEMF